MAKAATSTGKKKVFKKKEKRIVPVGVAHIQATFNNTLVSITDTEGRLVCWSSAGSLGFKGSRKGTPFAAQQAGHRAAVAARPEGDELVGIGHVGLALRVRGAQAVHIDQRFRRRGLSSERRER